MPWPWAMGHGKRFSLLGQFLPPQRFDDGNKHGQGKMTYANKEVYAGEWMGDKRHGKGTITFPNGDVFSGEWTSQQKRDANTQDVDETGSVAKRPKAEVSP